MSTDIQLQSELTPRQDKAWTALDDPNIRRILYGGAKGGGKSFFLCVWLFTFCWEIAVMADLQPSTNPPHVAWFGRKQATDLTATTLQTWREVIPEEYYELKGGTEKDPKHILIAGRIAIDYGGLDKQANINKFNSAEYIAFAVDQAEEVTKDEISVLRGSLRMVIKDRKGKAVDIPFKELYTANPRQCWLKSDFITNCPDNAKFVSALPSDNPHLPDSYIQTLKDAFGHRPELLAAYMDGDWSALEGAAQVILGKWLECAKTRTPISEKLKHFLVVDTARFGDDKTVIGRFVNTDCVEKLEFGKTKTTEISSRLAIESNKYGEIPIVVEATGGDIGAAVVDELSALGHDALVYCPQGFSTVIDPNTGKPKFYNLRAEAWWKAATMLADGFVEWNGIKYVVSCPSLDATIEDQLMWPTYDFRQGKLIIEPKSSIKVRHGASPDHGDMFVIGLWAFDKVDAVSSIYNLSDDDDEYYEENPMGLSNL
jgi:hypothetical protein